jgi:transposase-like protein
MDIITQRAYYRQRMVKSYYKYGGTETAQRYKTSRKSVYKWVGRYDGTIESLKDRSHRPHSSPRAHTEGEVRLVKRELKRVKWKDLLLAYQRLTEKGYQRSYGGFKRLASKLTSLKPKKKKVKKKPKPYARASYPGQKVQIDVKYVPKDSVVGGKKYYQFTAVDECTRWTYRQMYEEKSSYSAKQFLDELIRKSPFPIRMVQTDNGTEFTNALLVVKAAHKSLFEQALDDMQIIYKRIRIATPQHNGKVERRHRTDQMRFYGSLKMYSLADGRKQLAEYQKKSNDYIMTCLDMHSPNQVLSRYLAVM